MFNEARVHSELRTALMNATVPPIDLAEIRRRMSMRLDRSLASRPYARIAAAAAAVVIAGLFLTARSPALLQSLEERYRAALIAAGMRHGVPVPVPDAMREAIHQSPASLSQAQRRANFTIVPPAGLPHDIVSRKILVAPLAVWLKRTNEWNFDGAQVTFAYVRTGGRRFYIIADRYSSLNGPWPRYMYEVEGVSRNGNPIIKERDEHFVWRNGDQEMQATASPAISAREIELIRMAMHGVPLPRINGRSLDHVADRIVFYSLTP